jgi:hypothetical protein
MKKYYVKCWLEGEGVIEADTEEEAFEKLSDDLMAGGLWDYEVEEIEDEEEE